MKHLFVQFFIIFYSLGTVLLPMSNFSVIEDLPNMFKHCKTTEDKDMTVFDFVSDHLLNLDGMFDKHQNGDEQKPHKPFEYRIHHTVVQFVQELIQFEFTTPKLFVSSNQIRISKYKNILYSHSIISSIFRPPIFV